jgi:hypothetical protein
MDVSVLYTFSGTFPVSSDIWALPLFGERKPFPVIQTEFSEAQGAGDDGGADRSRLWASTLRK